MPQGPHIQAIQRVADENALLLPPERAVRIRLPLTIRRVPETDADGTLAGSANSPGEVSGYYELGLDPSLLPGLITSRLVNATAPLRVNGGASADLGTTNITLTINPATTTDPGSFSAADKLKLDGISAGAAVSNVTGVPPIVVVPAGTVRQVSISPATALTPGSMSTVHFNRVENMFTLSTPSSIIPDAVADTGIQAFAARTDHTHGIDTDIAGAILVGDTAAEGVALSFARSDHRHSLPAPAAPTVIQPDATASAGAATAPARADHTHGIDAATAGAILIGDAAAEGASTSFSRADHTHGLAAPAAPQSVGAANSAGASTAAARADHVHAHAYQQYMGANTLTGTTTTRYLSVGFNTGTASASILDMTVAKAFKIDSMAMLARVGGTAGQTISATIRKNGAAVGTAVLTTASDATTGSATFTAVSFAVNDTWGLEITKSGAIASSPTDIVWSVGMTPP